MLSQISKKRYWSCKNITTQSTNIKTQLKRKVSSKKMKIFSNENFSIFYDSISKDYYSVPENADWSLYHYKLNNYIFSFHLVLKLLNVFKIVSLKVKKHKTKWIKYNGVFCSSQWRNKMSATNIESILKYKNFLKWYKHWVKTILFHFYKNSCFLTLTLLLLNVLSIYLQTQFYYYILDAHGLWGNKNDELNKYKTVKVGDHFHEFSINAYENRKFTVIRAVSQACFNALFMIPSMIIKNYRNIHLLDLSAIFNVLTNIFYGIIDITYISNSEVYNLGIIYNAVNNKNMFDLFLVGKLITSIFVTPIILNFEEPRTTFFLIITFAAYLITYSMYLPSVILTMKLLHLTKFVLILFITISTIFYSRLLLKSRKLLFVKYALPYFIYLTFLNTDPVINAKIKEKKKENKKC